MLVGNEFVHRIANLAASINHWLAPTLYHNSIDFDRQGAVRAFITLLTYYSTAISCSSISLTARSVHVRARHDLGLHFLMGVRSGEVKII